MTNYKVFIHYGGQVTVQKGNGEPVRHTDAEGQENAVLDLGAIEYDDTIEFFGKGEDFGTDPRDVNFEELKIVKAETSSTLKMVQTDKGASLNKIQPVWAEGGPVSVLVNYFYSISPMPQAAFGKDLAPNPLTIKLKLVKRSAIVVLRHGCDEGHTGKDVFTFDEDHIDVSFTGSIGTVDGNTVTVVDGWLGGYGRLQEQKLGEILPDWINKRYQPVSRILSQGPGDGSNGTPNPILTIRQYADAICKDLPDRKLKLDLHDNDAYEKDEYFSVPNLLKDGIGTYSTVVAWEVKGMWTVSGDDKKYSSTCILGRLGDNLDTRPMIHDYPPEKCQMIYVFTYQDDKTLNLSVYNFDACKGTIEIIEDVNHWPHQLCTHDMKKKDHKSDCCS